MQVQQQICTFSKINNYKANYSSITNLVTIQQIYEVDTITLQQLIQQFQQQYSHQINNPSLPSQTLYKKKIDSKFSRLSDRQLRKWYQLAKLQLSQRKKIEDFALKLIQQEFQTNNKSFLESNVQSNPFLKIKNKQTLDKESINNQQISVKLPPIKQLKTLPQQNSIRKISQNKNLNNRSNLISQNLKHQKQEILQPSKTLDLLKQCSKTIEPQTCAKKYIQSKPLSKKQFLSMMKIKLNQGTQYKTKAFQKQPQKINIDNRSTTRIQVQKHVKSKIDIFDTRTKTKSVYIPTKSQIVNSITPVKNINKSSAITINSTKKISTYENKRYQNNSTFTSREKPNKNIWLKKNQSMTQNKYIKSKSTFQSKNKDILFDKNTFNEIKDIKDNVPTVQISKQDKLNIENVQKEKQNSSLSVKINKQSQLFTQMKKQHNLLNQNIKEQNKQLIFIQNQDAYDDEPQILHKQICLHQQIIQNNLIGNSIQPLLTETSEAINCLQIQKIHQDTQENNFNKYINQSQQTLNSQIQNHCNSMMQNQHFKYKQEISQQRFNQQLQPQKQISQIQSEQIQTKKGKSQAKSIQNSLTQISPQINVTNNKLLPKLNQLQKTTFSKIRSLSTDGNANKYPHYHLQFPTFAHLFHNKNDNSNANQNKFSLPHLLKILQHSLQIYFQKNIVKIAQQHLKQKIIILNNNQQNSANQQEQMNLQMKCITCLQFISSECQLTFNIDLSTFKQRSIYLLDKIKSNYLLSSNFYSIANNKNEHKNNLKQKQNNPLFYRVVKNKPEVYDIINTSFYRSQNWLQLPHGMELQGCWNLLWTWSKPQINFNSLIKFQKVNHFPGSKQLARKDLLKKNIQKIKKLSKKLNDYFDIIPQTFFLPGENILFIKKFRQSQIQGKNLWILKPVGLSRGRGISLINKLEQVVFSEPIVMQKYIHNPFLLEGYKFDLRIYVLVTSINPLQCFIYKQGFARVSTQRYCTDLEQIGNKFVHLTNYSIQKDSYKCPQMFTSKQKQLGGCKLTLKMLQTRFLKLNLNWDSVWAQIQEVVLKSLISCMKYIPQNSNCFELFGYDIMLDQNLKCWLIEVNSSPSLQKDFIIDEIIKQQLVDDIIEIVEPLQFDRQQLLKVIKRRRKQFEGMKSHVNYSNNSTDQLNEDLFYILKGKLLRNYGQLKEHKSFKCIAPGSMYQKILKTVQHYTHDPFVKNLNFY